MKRRKPLVIGNWKLNPGNGAEAKTLFSGVKKNLRKVEEATVVLAPPTLFIPEVAGLIKTGNVLLGAQSTHYEERGAVTGEVGPAMLASYGVSHIIVGHSEKRMLGVTDEQVNKKTHAILKRRLTPVVCIGERERDDQGAFFGEIEKQIKSLAEGLVPAQLKKIVIAYEPIWAIGTGKTATADDVREMQLFIVRTLTKLYDRKTAEGVHLIYGGSVKPSIASVLYENGGMNGFLVGGASLKAEDFSNIVHATIN